MQLREVGRKIQMLRTEYVPAQRDESGNLIRGTGRSKIKMLGSFDSWESSIDGIDQETLEKLTDAERGELEGHFEQKKRDDLARSLRHAPGYIVNKLRLLADNCEHEQRATDKQVDEIRAALSELMKVRRAARRKLKNSTSEGKGEA